MRVFSLAMILILLPTLQAQEAERGPDGTTTTHVTGVEVLEIPGEPFTAQSAMDWTRTAADGSTIKLHLIANIARDSRGRVYRERRGFVPAGATTAPPLHEIIVYDPAASTRMSCTMASRHCVLSASRPRTSFAAAAAGSFASGTRFLSRESLGSKTMNGLDVVGTRETVTVNPGVYGNDRPLISTHEFWYAPDLQTNLSVVRVEPANGQQVIQLGSLSRSEPEPSQFEPPSGFTVEDLPTGQAR